MLEIAKSLDEELGNNPRAKGKGVGPLHVIHGKVMPPNRRSVELSDAKILVGSTHFQGTTELEPAKIHHRESGRHHRNCRGNVQLSQMRKKSMKLEEKGLFEASMPNP
jgi:hypothetical protein